MGRGAEIEMRRRAGEADAKGPLGQAAARLGAAEEPAASLAAEPTTEQAAAAASKKAN